MSLRPTADEVLDSIIWTFEEQIVPAVDDEVARSAARTVSNLLAHLQVRLRLEGQALVDDNADLRTVLSEALDHPGLDDADAEGTLRSAIVVALAGPQVSPPTWPSVDTLSVEAGTLRSTVDLLVRRLAAHPTPSSDDLLRVLDAPLRRQLEREAPWAVDAFEGDRR